MIAGAAVQITSSRVLPWIGGPSLSSSPGRMRNLHTLYSTTVITRTKIGTETMMRTSDSVSIFLPSAEAWGGNQLISRPSAMPSADAIAPMTSSGTRWLRPDFSSPMRAASYATGATEGTAVRACLRGVRQAADDRHRRRVVPVAQRDAVGSEGGGREALMAAERLGELGGLAVADAVSDLAHGQPAAREQLGRAVHADAGEMLTKGRVADL